MGTENNRPIDTGTEGAAAETGNSNSESAGKRGRGRPRGSANKPKETVKQPAKSPKIVVVDLPKEDVKEDKPKEEKPKTTAAAARPKRSPAKKKPKKQDTQQLKLLVLTISGLVASRPGMEVWNMTPEEVDQVIEPLSNIMARHNVGEAASEYADYIALVMAAFVIFIPKYVIWKATRPPKQKKEKRAKINVKRSDNQNGTTERNCGTESTPPASDGTAFGSELHGLLPAII